ncbi:MAG: exodeoxyribonuclease VII small subunit [Lachnospiraceae bacterium]|jgi:exodeoxyribonuclease VII small subunit|nr:exodeoxyribonuclease VII small subunit [Lachnospiraceae bacterium]
MAAKKEIENETTLEEDFETLENLIKELSKDDVNIEEAFAKYEQGLKLLKNCNEKIDTIEKKVQVLTESLELKDFE